MSASLLSLSIVYGSMFDACLYFSNKSKILERRLRYISEYLDYKLYSDVCRGLFERHKLVFSFSLCARLGL